MTDTRRQALMTLGFGLAAILVSYFLLDRPVSTWSHAVMHRPAWCIWLTWIADVPAPASVAGLGALGIASLCGWRPGPVGRVALAVCIVTLTAVAAKDVLKFAFGRPWPETWVNKNPSWIDTGVFGFFPFHGGAGYASFPSGHTTAITAPFAVLWQHAGRFRWLYAVLPLLVVIGLLGCDYHFLSDCLAGACLGCLCAALYRLTRAP